MIDPLLGPIVIPLWGGLVCLLMPARWERLRSWLTIAVSAASLLAVWQLPSVAAPAQLLGGWMLLRVDGLSWLVLLAAACFALLIAIYSLDYMRGKAGRRLYDTCLLWSLAFAAGAFLAGELVLLVTSWGLTAVTLYLMIGVSGPDASEAARKSFVIVGGADALLLLSAALLYVHHGSTRMDAAAVSLDSPAAYIALLCFLAAGFAKLGAVPLHAWLPDCGQHALAPVTAYLPAALDKLLGVYLLVRVVTGLFDVTGGISTLLMFLGAITILSAAVLALAQQDLKRLLAYCAVGQVGYILLGIGTGTALGLAAALFHMLNHAIYKSCLFLAAGEIEQKTGTVHLDQLGGLATRLPITFATCLVAAMAVSGIPPLNGFASKWMVYQAVIEAGQDGAQLWWIFWLATAMIGSALTLALFVKVLHAAFLCKPSPQVRDARISPATWSIALPMAVLACLCVIFGVFAHTIPLPFLVLPAVGQSVSFPGTWWATQASGLLLIAFVLGWLVYALAMRNGKLRKVPTYIGGERLDEARIPGVPAGPDRHVEVTGVDFYRTIEQLPGLRGLYKLAQKQVFDIYETAAKAGAPLTGLLRRAHTGLLPTYLMWLVLGLLAILYLMIEGTP